MISCSFCGLTNSRSDCAATPGQFLSLFLYFTQSNAIGVIVSHFWTPTWPRLTWTNTLLSFKFLCNFRPPPSFSPFAVTFTHLSVRHAPRFTLPGLVGCCCFISFCFAWIQTSLICFLSFSPLCLFLLPFFCLTVSCDRSDHQAVYFDHSQDGAVCSFYSFQPCPPDLLLFLFFLSRLLLSHTSPSEIILFFVFPCTLKIYQQWNHQYKLNLLNYFYYIVYLMAVLKPWCVVSDILARGLECLFHAYDVQ